MLRHFHTPGTVGEALALQTRFQNRSAFMAGGTWLNSRDSAGAPEHGISLERLGLDGIEVERDQVSIGATCTLQRLIDEPRVPAPLRVAASRIANRNIRNMATLGGHVASRLPFSDLVPMLVALQASVVVRGEAGARTLRVEDDVATPASGLIEAIILPPAPERVAASRTFRASANARPVVSAAVSLALAGGAVRAPIVALGGVAGTVVRLRAIEQAMEGQPPPPLDDLQARVSALVRLLRAEPGLSAARRREPPEGSEAFRRYAAGAVVALAFRDALASRGEPS